MVKRKEKSTMTIPFQKSLFYFDIRINNKLIINQLHRKKQYFSCHHSIRFL